MSRMLVEPKATEYFHAKAAAMGIPLNGTFELTPCCNMDCRMCYVRLSAAQQQAIRPLRSVEEWLQLARIARDRGMLYLLLTGGEPFLRPDFRELMMGLHQMGFVLSINTNATLIDESVMEWLRLCPPTRVNVTLYGASDETYARLCRNPRGFTQATRGIRLLLDAGINVKINCSVTPHNAQDLEEIFAYCQREELVIQATTYMFPPLRKDEGMVGCNDRFTPEEAAYQAARVELLNLGQEAFLRRMESKDGNPIPQIPGDDCLELEGDGVRCRAGRCCFWVTWDGKFMPCGMFSAEGAPDVFEVGFDAAWTQAREQVKGISLPPKCAACEMKEDCKACAAMVYTESGEFGKVPEYRCRMTQSYHSQSQRLREEILAAQGEETE